MGQAWQVVFRYACLGGVLLLFTACTTTPAQRGDLEVSDSWINTRVQNEISELVDDRSRVDIRTEQGVVFLEGSVRTIEQVESIEEVTSQVRGVREVKNNLVVRP